MEEGWPSGPRLRTTVAKEAQVGCWHCGDEANQVRSDGSRIRMFPITLVPADGHALARVRVCDACIAGLPARPDPLDVTAA